MELHRNEGGEFLLRVRDNGVGFPKTLDFRRTETLGMQIVVTLVDQIDGTIEMGASGGTDFQIRFKEIPYKPSL